MKIKIVSDLHLEFSNIVIPNNGADVLILAGDIMVAKALKIPVSDNDSLLPDTTNKIKFRNFLSQVSADFKNVIYVAGNHEFYDGSWYKTIDILKTETHNYPNIHYLEDNSVTIDGITFVGSTLWTDLNNRNPITMTAITNMLSDYTYIRNDKKSYKKISPDDVVTRHAMSLKYISDIVTSNPSNTFVVVTHHAPSNQSISSKYKANFHSSGAYSSTLDQFILDHPQIKLWACGHNHEAHQYTIGTTQVVCNPRGYTHTNKTDLVEHTEDTNWDINLLIEIPAT